MNLTDTRAEQLGNSAGTSDEFALLRCRRAAALISMGRYEAAREALDDLWRGTGVRPNLVGLSETVAAEVLLQCGTLSGWLGTSKRVAGAQEAAKDLISEALGIFEARGMAVMVVEAQYELGMCYWRAGAFEEARVILGEALRSLERTNNEEDIERKAKILIRSTLVEVSAGRYHDAMRILTEAEPVFKTANDALKGRWHGQKALVLRRLGQAENRSDYFDRAIIEHTAAIFHNELAGHERYCGNNLNNLAHLLSKLGRYEEAHQHLDRAQKIFARLNDKGSLAQVNETRARVLLSEGRYTEAATVIKGAVETLDRAGEQALLADALAVQATILARLGEHERSLPTFRHAINVAEDAGAGGSAGRAALTMIEEHGASRISDAEVYQLYCRADELLTGTQDGEDLARLRACARIMGQRLFGVKLDEDFSLPEAVRAYEARFIERALRETGGSVTHAAKRLGLQHQSLAYLLQARHKDLYNARTPVVRRKRSIIKREDSRAESLKE